MTTQQQADRLIDWIHGARAFGEKRGLSNMRRLLDVLGHPERRFKSIHVAGTNGKGSVCALLERALRENGYRTGLYTSPYLVRYQERMRLDGVPVCDELFARLGERVYGAAQQLLLEDIRPTSFELGTALAFLVFAEAQVDVAVLEVGLGGRLDPTNVIEPELTLIANIGLDHQQILGDTIAEIAREKAGIAKPGVPMVLYPIEANARQAIARVCDDVGAPIVDADPDVHIRRIDGCGAQFDMGCPGFGPIEVAIQMPGRHQVSNALLALTALGVLKRAGWRLDRERVLLGIRQAEWPGRLQWVTGNLLLDGAHNEQGARALADFVRDLLPGRRIVLLTAMMRDKRPEACAKVLAPLAKCAVTTQVDQPRALPAEDLAELYAANGIPSEAIPDAAQALDRARALAGQDGIALVCGSLYLVGAIEAML